MLHKQKCELIFYMPSFPKYLEMKKEERKCIYSCRFINNFELYIFNFCTTEMYMSIWVNATNIWGKFPKLLEIFPNISWWNLHQSWKKFPNFGVICITIILGKNPKKKLNSHFDKKWLVKNVKNCICEHDHFQKANRLDCPLTHCFKAWK